MSTSCSVKMRRRGAELELAILEAAWAELVESGYARLTMENVASRTGTSRPVLARRWDSKYSLAIAALRHQREKYPLQVTECGDLRTELLDFLERACGRASLITVFFSLLTNEYSQDPASSPQTLRDTLIKGEGNALSSILQRAVERGEIDAQKLVPEVKTLLSDLFRHHAIMTLSAPPSTRRETWVDTIFLPLVRKT